MRSGPARAGTGHKAQRFLGVIYIPNRNHDPALNLAMEEYILAGSGIREPVLFFYINAPSIIIGRHQNTYDEINSEYVQSNHIQVVRRCSGGGAVYHDLGNLNYSLITPGNAKASCDFSVLLIPIRDALQELGLPAEINGRNDLTVSGAKFSGNAYYHNRHGSVTHGTLLYDSDLDVLSKALQVNPQKLQTKGVSSIRSRVCCIKSLLPGICSIEELEKAIVRHFAAKGELKIREFSREDLEKITETANGRYRNEYWNYGEPPVYTTRLLIHQPCGWIDFRADIPAGTVRRARFYGDFFCTKEIGELENALTGVSWKPEEITGALISAGWQDYFPEFPVEEFVRMLFSGQAGA